MLGSCVAHSSAIHAIHGLYSMTLPHRLMTYQVSYCIFIAAVVEVKQLNLGVSEQHREDAAKRLASALSVLQAEASHTPGSGRSLNTIRRLLAAERPRVITMPSSVAVNQDASVPLDREARPGHNEMGSMDLLTVDQDYLINATIPEDQLSYGSGWADTSAGFHPEAFPWASLGIM